MATVQELIASENYTEAIKLIEQNAPTFDIDQADILKQYVVSEHDVFDAAKRPKKQVNRAKLDDQGNPITTGEGANQKIMYETTFEEVTRVGLSLQEYIVESRVGFLCGNPVRLELNDFQQKESAVFKMVELLWNENKLDYKNIDLATALFSECDVAELWYLTEDPELWTKKAEAIGINTSQMKFVPNVHILKRSDGYELFPEFDENKKLKSFSYRYKVKVNNVETTRLVYMDETTLAKAEVINGTWTKIESVPNTMKKIPVVYYYQKRPEWAKVQTLINQVEKRLSNLGDENDYFGSPMMYLKGNFTGFASKGERGKMLTGDSESDAKIMSWDNAPESTKLEFEKLESNIMLLTHTPNISFDNMKGLVGNIPIIGIKALFLDAHLAIKLKEAEFGSGLTRRLNLLKSIIAEVIAVSLAKEANLITIKPIIVPYLPSNIKEEVEVISTAKQMGIMSIETAVNLNPLVIDKKTEMERIKAEKKEGETFQI